LNSFFTIIYTQYGEQEVKAKALEDIFSESQEKNPIKLAELSGKSVAYVKKFLNSNVPELEVVSNSKIGLKKC
jgi:hypothetical protein